ncbi:hypothetical protein [Desulfallas thermosapovorans]|uniref:Uncharacterized protein n=1 Tax=Desulfallas thermosapovorans DSM 6562 TaxID=1121431 RepID=A0A5S4ZNW5_9FIRM|nr:hypothetical protein [Desulfallas thermosapovorans]TYO94526.1 hypothetical protein LX24_02362 [Desulfallas thermosapovorans DSM 6562]
MKFRVDGLGFFGSRQYDTLEEARANIYDKKGRKGNITVELAEKEYVSLINSYNVQLQKNMGTIQTLQQENQNLKNQILHLQNTLIRPEVVEEIRRQAHHKLNAEVKAREKITLELTNQLEAMAKREKGLRDALGRWQKKATGEDMRPPKDLKQKGFQCNIIKKRLVKVFFLEKYLPLPFDTQLGEVEKYALQGLSEKVQLKKIYLDRGKWVARFESHEPLEEGF